jgi:transmembrane sensor
MNDDILQKLVKKYLNDECSPQEIQRLHEWYNSFDEDQDIIDFLTPEQLQQLRQRLLSRIRKNISADIEASQAIVNKNRSSKRNTYLITGIAATVLLVMGLFLFRSSDTISPLRSMSAEIVVFNTSKSIQKVILEDSSIVWLNPNSKIVYPRKFLAASRELHMHGEAFFEVTPDANRPFIIYSDNIITL